MRSAGKSRSGLALRMAGAAAGAPPSPATKVADEAHTSSTNGAVSCRILYCSRAGSSADEGRPRTTSRRRPCTARKWHCLRVVLQCRIPRHLNLIIDPCHAHASGARPPDVHVSYIHDTVQYSRLDSGAAAARARARAAAGSASAARYP